MGYLSGNADGFIFNQNGQRVSVWDINSGTQKQGETYWGAEPVEYNYANQANYFHEDWQGTGRVYTAYNGNTVLTVNSLPFGDGSQFGTVGYSPWTFAYVDEDYYSMADSGTAHAQYRQYGNGQGRWFSPDPYGGSYDFSNPQSLNRYSYVINNPLTFTDPSGQIFDLGSGGAALCGPECAVIVGGIGAIYELYELFGKSSFHGSLKPRPNAPDWNGNFGESLGLPVSMPQGNWGLGLALSLPHEGCEFGSCGGGISGFQNGYTYNPNQSPWAPPTFLQNLGELLLESIGPIPMGDSSGPTTAVLEEAAIRREHWTKPARPTTSAMTTMASLREITGIPSMFLTERGALFEPVIKPFAMLPPASRVERPRR